MTEKLYYKYWEKASSVNENGAGYHLLPYHCLDVAAVADAWWEASQSLRQQFIKTMQTNNPQQAKAWVGRSRYRGEKPRHRLIY